MNVTIHDVAARVGVSASTVSRAFSRPEKVAARTREKIIAAAQEVGYESIHDGESRSIRSSVGVIFPDLNNPFFAEILKGMQEYAGFEIPLVLMDFNEIDALEEEAVNILKESVGSLILCSSRMPKESIIHLSQSMPVVLINRSVPGVSDIHFDNIGGMRQAIAHLQALGHKRIGYVGGPISSRSASAREEEFVVKDSSTIEKIVLGNYAPTVAGGSQAADDALNSGATAVITYNDIMAIGLLNRLASYGLQVPECLSVVSFDDIPIAGMVTPGLTTVSLPREEAGRSAIPLLLEVKNGAAPRSIDLPTELVVRASTRRAN